MIVKFKRHYHMVYGSNLAGDLSGEYVPLAEYDKLKSLIQRVNEIAPKLSDWDGLGQSLELKQLLKDCQEVL